MGYPWSISTRSGTIPASQSPSIKDLEWGRVHTEIGDFRDSKLWPGGGRGWDWNETGTHHSPGVQVADVRELVENGSRIVIIGCGQSQRLEVLDETREWLEDQGSALEILESSRAADRYNALCTKGAAVGALIHSTC